MLIRNDDVSVDTTMEDIVWFSELCDKYGFRVIQCITPLGMTHGIDSHMSNDEIVAYGGKITILDNMELIKFLANRTDIFAIHGLWHCHYPSYCDLKIAQGILEAVGLSPDYYVPPFNELGSAKLPFGMKVSAKTQRLEDYHESGTPTDEIVYLHSWRYGTMYQKEKLEKCLERLTTNIPVS